MNCEKYKAQIEEQFGREALPIDTVRHIEACADCHTFDGEHKKLREMLDCLQSINAPSDFNFRLKARMKRAEKPVSAWTWQRLASAGTATVAALAVGFVVLNSSSISNNTANANNPIEPSITQQLQQSNVVAEAAPVITSQPPVIEDKKEIAEVDERKPQIAQRDIKTTRIRKAQPKNADDEISVKDSQLEEIQSKDSAVVEGKQATPRGIPNPLEAPKKQDAKEILLTLGVETEAAPDGLRVTKSNRVDLKTGDIIQKVNDENPAAVSGGLLNEIKLTVRRQDQTKEVKILAKP